jgi:hypothetical protein
MMNLLGIIFMSGSLYRGIFPHFWLNNLGFHRTVTFYLVGVFLNILAVLGGWRKAWGKAT